MKYSDFSFKKKKEKKKANITITPDLLRFTWYKEY